MSGAQASTGQSATRGRPRGQRQAYRPNDPANPTHLRDNRPSLRVTTRRAVFRDAQRAPNGEDFICPSSGEIIPCQRDANGNAIRYDDNGRITTDGSGYTYPAPNPRSDSGQPAVYHFGHVPESEYRRLIQLVEDHPGVITNREFRNAYNEPDHYQVEHPVANTSHGHESTTPGYGHYSHLVPSQPSSGTPPATGSADTSANTSTSADTGADTDADAGAVPTPRFRR